MKTELTKNHFDSLLKKFFCVVYQNQHFENTFHKHFDREEPLQANMALEYKIKGSVHADLYELFNKFGKKYDCVYYTENNSIIFKPEFSDVKNTYWVKMTA